ncbi:MAG: isocitrate lyase/phosphoenolpyruvate mutase family protein [Acidobacteriia bacterium]|nr:isocitrate lyase/phosphoenolpyruvate mutase family protein [Terriglobia bacterium]
MGRGERAPGGAGRVSGPRHFERGDCELAGVSRRPAHQPRGNAACRGADCRQSQRVSADLEAAYGDVEATARALVEAGAVGLNFEDGTGDPAHPLADPAEQCERIRRIRATGENLGVHIVINARTDVYLDHVGEPATRFEHTVERLNAYRQAGADCLFAPGVQDGETIGRLVKGLKGPLNVLAGPATPPVRELERLGVARLSFGSWPARSTWGLFQRLTRELREKGTFTTLAEGAIPYAEINKLVE